MKAVYEVLTVQRDFGNREDRKKARLKYTVDKYGADFLREEIEKRAGFKLLPARKVVFTERADYYGWEKNHEGNWYYTLFIENGRVLDDESIKLKSGLLKVAETGKANFRFTCNQNLILSDIKASDKKLIEKIWLNMVSSGIPIQQRLFARTPWLVLP
jgi:sulfite reductase (NADPH) hemoprotein beta-component